MPDMKECTFSPLVTATFVDGEVQSVVVDWGDSQLPVPGAEPEDEIEMVEAFDAWLVEKAGGFKYELYPEEE